MRTEIRLEQEKDYREVENLTREAFWNVYRPGCDEHLIIHKLRNQPSFIPELDYIALCGEKIVGSIAYSKMYCQDKLSEEVISFGPVCVHPGYQNQGIGTELIKKTMGIAAELGYQAILITGNPSFYHSFGFISASRYGVRLRGMSEGEETDFFMAAELKPGYFKENPGIYHFDSCFETTESEVKEFEKCFLPKNK